MDNSIKCSICDEAPEGVVTDSDGVLVCVECHADGEA